MKAEAKKNLRQFVGLNATIAVGLILGSMIQTQTNEDALELIKYIYTGPAALWIHGAVAYVFAVNGLDKLLDKKLLKHCR